MYIDPNFQNVFETMTVIFDITNLFSEVPPLEKENALSSISKFVLCVEG